MSDIEKIINEHELNLRKIDVVVDLSFEAYKKGEVINENNIEVIIKEYKSSEGSILIHGNLKSRIKRIIKTNENPNKDWINRINNQILMKDKNKNYKEFIKLMYSNDYE